MFKVHIHKTDYYRKVDIYITEERADRKYAYLTIVDKLPMVNVINEGEIPEPFLTFSGLEATQILQEFAEALDKEGIKTDKDAKIQGTLEATKYHLEDLRKILKLK